MSESQPQVSLRHPCARHPYAKGEHCQAVNIIYKYNIIRGNSDLVEKRCQQTVGGHLLAKLHQTHGLVCLKHGDGVCLYLRNLLQLRCRQPAVLGWEDYGATDTMVVGRGQISCQRWLHRRRINQTSFYGSVQIQILSIAVYPDADSQLFVPYRS